jgi:hypothetical protein
MYSQMSSIGLATMTGVATIAGFSTAAFAAAELATPASVVVFDQQIKSKAVDITYAFLPAKGYVTVYGSDATGNPVRTALGTAELSAGDHRNVKVNLTEEAKPGQRMWISLYRDRDGKPGFDAKGDQPIWPDKLPSENAFMAR